MSAEPDLLRADQQARVDALDITQSFIVQAPAGSGKTELLIQRYLRLLATVEHPEEVLAITFTRKAAAEMRVRVLDALQRSQRGEKPDMPHQQITADAANAVLAKDSSAGWQLIRNPRRMRIQTLDSLNASIARMQPLTATGATSGNAIVDESLVNTLYEQAAAATLDWLGQSDATAAATHDVLLHVDGSTGQYIRYLAQMLRSRDQWLPFVSSGSFSSGESDDLRRRFERNLERLAVAHLNRLARACPAPALAEILALGSYAAGNLLVEGVVDDPICALQDLTAVPTAQSAELRTWQGVAWLLLTKDGRPRRKIDRRQGFPAGNKTCKQRYFDLQESLEGEAFLSLLHEVRGLPPLQYSDDQWSVLLSLFRLLPVAVAELRRIMIAKGVTDHIDVALTAGAALGGAEEPGDLALLLDYQVRHILVDEMQDTSKAQYRMLEALTGGWEPGDGRTIFCVGDPMQSIYRFRNAEVAQFLLARQSGIGNVALVPLTLRRNFRSGAGLVRWFNDVFPAVLASEDDAVNGAVAYSDAVAVDTLSNVGECVVHALFGGDRDAEAKQGIRIIRETLANNPADNMAVLVRSRTHLPQLLKHLRAAGIAYQAVEIDRLTDLPEVIDLLALTRAIVHSGDRVAWLALLRSPWVGLTWTDLHSLVVGNRHATILELLADENRVADLSDNGQRAVARFAATIRPIMNADRSAALHRRVEDAWYALGGPAMVADAAAIDNVYHYIQVLSTLETGGTLADIAELETQLDTEHVSANVQARLQIITMHKAKGLEFDHVLLLGLGRFPASNRPSVMSWLDYPDEHGNEEKIVSPIGRSDDVDKDGLHQYIEKKRREKDRYEQARLLYVACTRARKSLHLLGTTRVNGDGSEYRAPYTMSLLSLLWPAVETHYEKSFDAATVSREPDDSGWTKPVLRRFDTPWKLPEPAPVPGGRVSAVAIRPEQAIEYDWVGLDARLVGTVVHRWLQLATDGRANLDEAGELRLTSARWLTELGASAQSIDTNCERVLRALAGLKGDNKGQWLLNGDGVAELALTGVLDGELKSVVIDRVRIDDDGTHWIVDYKTSAHEGGNLQHFLDEECKRYRDQLATYARLYSSYSGASVRCALYFPLLQEFVEVSV